MAGNVWEWCWDCYGTYPTGLETDPHGPSGWGGRVIHGGDWYNNAVYCRVAYRSNADPGGMLYNLGLRSVRSNLSFALIPGGTFTMGDTLDGMTDATPHTVNVSAFSMQKTETTKAEWDDVRSWGLLHGYTDLAAGAGTAGNHPVQTVSWYDIVKWCNAKSEKEGLTPFYYTDAAQTTVFRTGSTNINNTMVKWTANGYRLPTEAEWEKAARGGLSGKRYPLGDSITPADANYAPYGTTEVGTYAPNASAPPMPVTIPASFTSPRKKARLKNRTRSRRISRSMTRPSPEQSPTVTDRRYISIEQAAKLKVVDPACGSGSFLIVAYQFLLDWHRDLYAENPEKWSKGKHATLYQAKGGEWRLTTAEKKRILLKEDSGGQKINKTSNCVFLKNLPSGVCIKCQMDRSRELNRFLARRELCEQLEFIRDGKSTARTQAIEKLRSQKRRRSRRSKQRSVADKRLLSQKKKPTVRHPASDSALSAWSTPLRSCQFVLRIPSTLANALPEFSLTYFQLLPF